MLLAEEYLLLTTDQESGKSIVDSNRRPMAVAGALFAELTLRERIGMTSHELPRGERDRLEILAERTTEDPILDAVLIELADKGGKKPADVLSRWDRSRKLKNWERALFDRLVARGVMREEKTRVLGIFPQTRHPEADPGPERELRARVNAALLTDAIPEPRTAALIALLHASKALPKILSPETDRKAATRRAKEIIESEWASQEVVKAINRVISASAAVTVAAASASS